MKKSPDDDNFRAISSKQLIVFFLKNSYNVVEKLKTWLWESNKTMNPAVTFNCIFWSILFLFFWLSLWYPSWKIHLFAKIFSNNFVRSCKKMHHLTVTYKILVRFSKIFFEEMFLIIHQRISVFAGLWWTENSMFKDVMNGTDPMTKWDDKFVETSFGKLNVSVERFLADKSKEKSKVSIRHFIRNYHHKEMFIRLEPQP